MSTKKYIIRMGNPCSYGWENMTLADKGRHCSQCDKVVIDFTAMNDTELIEFLLKNKNVCGHFKRSQLDRTIIVQGPQRYKLPHWPAIAAMLVAGLFIVAPSHLNAQKTQAIKSRQYHQLYPRNTFEKNLEKDSTVTIKIKVIDSHTKKPLKADVLLDNLPLESDKTGYYTYTVDPKYLPKQVTIQVFAPSHKNFVETIDVADLTKKGWYVIPLVYQEPMLNVDGGDIYIEH